MELLSEQQQWYRNEYLLSDEWKERAKQRRAIDGFKCAICGKKGCLSVHHISYANIGNENVETDLVTLCEECHKSLHEQIKQHKNQLQEIDKEWRDAAHEALLPVMEKYRAIAGEEYANIAAEFNGGSKPKISTLIRLIRKTSGYEPGYGQIYCSRAETSSSSVAMKKYSEKRKIPKKEPQKEIRPKLSCDSCFYREHDLPKIRKALNYEYKFGRADLDSIAKDYTTIRLLTWCPFNSLCLKSKARQINKTLKEKIFDLGPYADECYITEEDIDTEYRIIFSEFAEETIRTNPTEALAIKAIDEEFDRRYLHGRFFSRYKDWFIECCKYYKQRMGKNYDQTGS